jgi:hypothetical protein
VSIAARQYARFLSAGIAVGVASIVFFEVLRHALEAQGGWLHGLVVSLTYVFGALLSYQLQQRYVFSRRMGRGVAPFAAFFALTVALSLVVGALSAALLELSAVQAIGGVAAPAATLIVAALVVSPLSFGATRLFFQRLART